MARVGTSSNLDSNSRYDLLIFDYPDGFPVGGLNLEFGKTPKRISGVEKVTQVFLKTLLTFRGSDVVHSGRGTLFPSYTGNYNLQTNDLGEARSLVINAVNSAADQAKSILNIASADLTSQLEMAEVVGLSNTSEGVDVQIKIVTRAGESAPIALPFTSLGIQVNA